MTFTFPDDVPVIGGLRACGTQAVANWYTSSGGIEPLSLELVRRLLPVGGVFVDVGANIGVFSLAAALVAGDGGVVHAFEPASATLALLDATLRLHDLRSQVVVHPIAAGAQSGRRTFFTHDVDLLSSFGVGPLHAPGNFAETVVQEDTLDGRVTGVVDMLKIDIEGFEPEVLLGARRLLAENPDIVILCEVGPACLRDAGYDVAGLVAALPAEGRSLWVIDDRSEPGPLGRISRYDEVADWVRSEAPAVWYGNFLSVPVAAERLFRDLVHR